MLNNLGDKPIYIQVMHYSNKKIICMFRLAIPSAMRYDYLRAVYTNIDFYDIKHKNIWIEDVEMTANLNKDESHIIKGDN